MTKSNNKKNISEIVKKWQEERRDKLNLIKEISEEMSEEEAKSLGIDGTALYKECFHKRVTKEF